VLKFRPAHDYPHPDNPNTRVHVFETGSGGPHAELHVAVQPDLPAGQQDLPAFFNDCDFRPTFNRALH
jgi:glyoxalase family protein